jgi:uncharacterized membrane protein SirB2
MTQSPAVPPTIPGALPSPKTRWPKVLGVISVILGILGVLGGVWNLVFQEFIGGFTMGQTQAEQQALQGMRDFARWNLAYGLVGAVVAAALLVAGIGLIKRRRMGAQWAKGWAIAKMVLVIGGAVLAVLMQQGVMAAAQQSPGSPAMMGSIMAAMTVVTVVFALAWGWALPLFVLIWLGRAKIREEVSTWP